MSGTVGRRKSNESESSIDLDAIPSAISHDPDSSSRNYESDLTLPRGLSSRVLTAATDGIMRRDSSVTSLGSNQTNSRRNSNEGEDGADSNTGGGGDGEEVDVDDGNGSSAEFSYGSAGGVPHSGPRRERRSSFTLKPPAFLSRGPTTNLDLIGEDDSADHGVESGADRLGPMGSLTQSGLSLGGVGGAYESRPPMSRSANRRSAANFSMVNKGGSGGLNRGVPGGLSQSLAVVSRSASGGGVEKTSLVERTSSGGGKMARSNTIRSTFAINRRPKSGNRAAGGSNASGNSGGDNSSVGGGGRTLDTEAALAVLGGSDGQSANWESVAAAAALVAGEAEAAKSSSRQHRRYGVGDRVLVSLSVLNATLGGGVFGTDGATPPTDHEGEATASKRIEALRESSTLVPVNKFGYPPGGAPMGSTQEENRGPYGYVLATVARVHFDEDALYYTVTRADTGSEQRADAEWMEPVTSEEAYAAALFAAQTTKESTELAQRKVGGGERRSCADVGYWFHTVVWTRAVSWYGRVRMSGKVQATNFLYGNQPYGCRLQFSGVNFLVLCSFIYMFIDQARLAFCPASADFVLMIISAVVWAILTIELLFEVLVRPSGYSALIVSEKAYAPSTARFINGFHLFFELVALTLFVPDFRCFSTKDCGAAYTFSLMTASLNSILGPTSKQSFYGHLYFATVRFRIFNLVRHWKKMWINHTFDEPVDRNSGIKGYWVPETDLAEATSFNKRASRIASVKKERDSVNLTHQDDYDKEAEEEKAAKDRRRQARQDDRRLNKAATIGTALMVVNSHRAMLLVVSIVGILPLIYCVMDNGGTNISMMNSVIILQENNVLVPGNDEESCDYLDTTVQAWVSSLKNVVVNSNEFGNSDRTETLLLWAQVLPARCSFGDSDGVITRCSDDVREFCDDWEKTANMYSADLARPTPESFAEALNLRSGAIDTHTFSQIIEIDGVDVVFNATAMFNQGHTIAFANLSSFLLQTVLLVLVLLGLTVLRGDAGQLVLNPLRRMLKIVLRYAANPLSQTVSTRKRHRPALDDDGTVDSDSDFEYAEKNELGTFETEQLISAIAKITDLLRKCWGVAGADIISTNLARTQDGKTVVFNPTVAGKRVYALFGFAGINDFGHLLRSLDQDVMVLINDIARIVHEEVYRWGLGDSGQCNKNLGGAFLMVYRIGDFKEVQEKKARATEVIFTSSEKQPTKAQTQALKRRGYGKRFRKKPKELDTLQLASLPGIQAFTDRALLGMLKSFAGIYRDRALLKWTKDFRLGAGVDAFSLGLIFGMDAGWGVEGAVGSEYKIDATYLSPHVNMASRMMSACKQYGVIILLSQAVEKLLSEQARSKLRHIDTVTVKGSTLKQQIFTYDAQHKGVDFFLFERSAKQSDADSDGYNPKIWETDQDLKAMRQHISDDFEEVFSEGRKAYLAGKWDVAMDRLKEADRIMITTNLEEGFMEYEAQGYFDQLMEPESPGDDEEVTRLRSELGDGPCRCLLAYMKKEGGVAPKNWRGVRPLTSK